MASKKPKSTNADAPEGAENLVPEGATESPSGARECHQNERATEGAKRFKIRALSPAGHVFRYVLAPDREAAETEYMRTEGLDQLPDDAAVRLHCSELPD